MITQPEQPRVAPQPLPLLFLDPHWWAVRIDEVHAFGRPRARVLAVTRLLNVVMFSVALAVALVDYASPAGLVHLGPSTWPGGQRNLVVVNMTGDPAWTAAVVQSAQAWDDVGAGIHLSVASGQGQCHSSGPRIELCGRSFALLNRGTYGQHFEGITDTSQNRGGHLSGAVINVCSDCELTPDRRVVIVTHELGHAMGLIHTLDPTSVMYPLGGAERPSPADRAVLLKLYPPVARCGTGLC